MIRFYVTDGTRGLVLLINQVDDYFDHHVLFFSTALGNHQREGDKRVVRDALMIVEL